MPVITVLLFLIGAVTLIAIFLALSEWERRVRVRHDVTTYWADRHRRGAGLEPIAVARMILKPRLVPMPDWVPKGDDSRSN